MANSSTTVALVVSAGRGHRFGGPLPKQYAALGTSTVVGTTVSAFLSHPNVDRVAAVIHPDDEGLYSTATEDYDLPPPIHGGPERQDSVRLGLEAIRDFNPDNVLIHDAVRPNPSFDLIDRVINGIQPGTAALPALPVTDTLKRASDGLVSETVDRSTLWRAQTPQGFRFDDIFAAHQAAKGKNYTDDAAVAEAHGVKVGLVAGSEENYKITTPEDLRRMQRLTGAMGHVRVGTGFDVHRFAEGQSVVLCGVEIPHSASLEGHSDADVALHALTDALLGAAGLGDIGTFFPPSDDRWRNTESHLFVSHAAKMIAERGGEIVNADITIICEAPKIGPHRETMRNRVAEILKIEPDRVNIKGTTTEQLGFTGRGEGIAAQAAASVVI